MTASPEPASADARLGANALLLGAAATGELASRLTGSEALQIATLAMVALTILAYVPRFGLRETYLALLSAVLGGTILIHVQHPVAVLLQAGSQAAFFMAFIVLVGMLYTAAQTSPAIVETGRYITRQPPGRRYVALNSGTAFLAILFNIGVVSFLLPLIQRGIRETTPDDALNPLRERRQVSAALRGFAWCVLWSPTAVAPLALLHLIPGVDRGVWMFWGALIFLGAMAVGWAEDRYTFRKHRPRSKPPRQVFPFRAALRLGMACAWLLGMSVTVAEVWSETVVFGLMVSCPLMLVGWIAVQNDIFGAGDWGRAAPQIATSLKDSLSGSVGLGVTMAFSGFVGSAAASVVPTETIIEALHLDTLPDFILLGCIPLLVTVFGLMAFSPIVVAVFLGTFFGSAAEIPADPTLIALSISCGWSLSMTASPFATVNLLIQRVSGIPAKTVSIGWNLRFTLLMAVLLFPIFALLTGGR